MTNARSATLVETESAPRVALTTEGLADHPGVIDMAKGTCSIDGCERPTEARGWCELHYTRFRRYGDPLGGVRLGKTTPLEARFWAKVDKSGLGGCWLWTAQITASGYGGFWTGKPDFAHRYAYQLLVGPIPAGRQLDHLCRVRHCVNPAHLEPVTGRENTLRGEGISATNARKTRCKYGHPFDAENTYTYRGSRICKTCMAERLRRRRAALRSEVSGG